MQLFLISLSFLICCTPCMASRGIHTLEIQVETPPAQRFVPSVNYVLDRYSWEYSFGPAFKSHNESLFDHLPPSTLAILWKAVQKYYPEQAQEVIGIANAFRIRGYIVSPEYLSGWIYFHELAHTEYAKGYQPKECCGVLVRLHPNQILHGRNMDQSPSALLRNITVSHVWKQNGKVLFRSVDWYWFTTGFMTSVRPSSFALEENWRMNSVHFADVMEAAVNGTLPQVFVFRQVNMAYSTVDEALKFISVTPLSAPMYVVISSPGDGFVVTLGDQVPSQYRVLSLNNSYVVQTNYDHWLPDPPNDPRRTAAEELLVSLGADAYRSLGVFAVLSQPPVQNGATVYSTVMDASLLDVEEGMFVVVRT